MASGSSGEESGEDARSAAHSCSATGTLTLEHPTPDPRLLDGADPTPLGAADRSPLDVLSAALDGLVGWAESGGLEACDGLELVEFLRRFERVRNRMSLVDHAALNRAERQGLAGQLT